MTDEDKLKKCGNDQRILAVVASEIAKLGCPAADVEIAAWFEASRVKDDASRPLEHVHELIKLKLRFFAEEPSAEWGSLAVQALEANPQGSLSVWTAIKMHKTLEKTGVAGIGDAFKNKAREVFPLATYFAAAE